MSKTELRTSIIIPTRNAITLLAPLISVLRKQSRKPLEIIVVDSSSDDGIVVWLNGWPAGADGETPLELAE